MEAVSPASKGLFAKLAGSRAILMINVAGLLMACILAAERSFVEHQISMFARPIDIWVYFVPAIVMFIVRRATLSIIFLIIYVALDLLAGREVWMILAGTPIQYPGGKRLGLDDLFVYASVILLPVFLFVVFIRWLAKAPA